MQPQQENTITIEEQTITNYIIDGVILGYEFRIRYLSEHKNSLKWIDNLEIRIDGESISPKTMYIYLNNQSYFLEELLHQPVCWVSNCEAIITILKKGGIIKGMHAVCVELSCGYKEENDRDKDARVLLSASKSLIAE